MTTTAIGVRSWAGIALSVIWIMWRREMRRYFRDRSQMFGGLSRTILWLVVLGFGLGATLRIIEGYSYAQYILPGVIILNVLFASLQCAIALVWDREVGLLREVIVSPAPVLSVALGKILGGATIAVLQGSIPLLFLPLIDVSIDVLSIFEAWVVMFFAGIFMTSVGIVIASYLRSFEGFGAISNGIIQPLYFLSGSIFPLRGIIGGVGFLNVSTELREMARREGLNVLGGGWVVQLPTFLQVLVYANPVSYHLDMLRYLLLDYRQLSLTTDLLVTFALPPIAIVIASYAMSRTLRRK